MLMCEVCDKQFVPGAKRKDLQRTCGVRCARIMQDFFSGSKDFIPRGVQEKLAPKPINGAAFDVSPPFKSMYFLPGVNSGSIPFSD